MSESSERRGHVRIEPKGSVIVRIAGDVRHGRIANIGAGGMFIADVVAAVDAIGDGAVAAPAAEIPQIWDGRDVEIELRFDGARAEWLHATGRIARIRDSGIAIAFQAAPPAELLLAIDELITASLAHDRRMSVVLIDADPQRRSSIAEGFRATGCTVAEAATPLDAIHQLGANNFEPDVIAVADSQPSAAADQMRAFIERDHPHVLLVTIGDELFAPDGMADWLSSADPKADLARRVRDVLVGQRRR